MGTGGASHCLGRATELYDYPDHLEGRLAFLPISNNLLGIDETHRQRICPIDITTQPVEEDLNKVLTDSLWGVDHKGLDGLLGSYWIEVTEMHRQYSSYTLEAYCMHV